MNDPAVGARLCLAQGDLEGRPYDGHIGEEHP